MCDQGESCGDVDQNAASSESEPEVDKIRDAFDPELDHSGSDDDDDREEEEVVKVIAPSQNCFSLNARNSTFTDRCSKVFDSLDTVGLTNSSSLNEQKMTDIVFTRPTLPTRKTSTASPNCPTPLKKRGVPDYLVHPERWTHYSLEDVSESSDMENSRAALNFLSSLQQKKTPDSSSDVQERVIFSALKQTPKEQPTNPVSALKGKRGALHLGHLEEEEEKSEDGREKEKAEEEKREQSKDVNMSGDVGPVEEDKVAQKEKGNEESCPGFTSSRKIKSRNYRKSSTHQED